MKNKRVFGFGITLVDTMVVTNKNIKLDTKTPINQALIQLGGVIPTALLALTRLNTNCDFSGCIGDDEYADVALNFLKKSKIKIKDIIKLKFQDTPLAVVLIEKNSGKRTIFYNTGCFSKLTPASFKSTLNNNYYLALLDGHNYKCAQHFINQAKKLGISVLLDVGSPKENVEKLISQSDVIFVPEGYWSYHWPKKSPTIIVKKLLSMGAKTVAVTMGEKGCYIGNSSKIFYQPAFKVRAIDTNGAGDVFMGSFAYGLLKDWSIETITEFASAAAAMSCRSIGKNQGIPKSRLEIKKFIANTKTYKN